MEKMLVKSEVNCNGRRRSVVVEADGPNVVRCVKRRRREPALPTLSIATNASDELLGQSSTATATTTVKRSSRFRGVSKHRWTGRYEAHLWDKGSWNATQRKKGKQVYLGAYDEEESASRAYDLAALKYWGPTTFTNFPVSDYEKEIQIMQNVTKEEYLASLRRKSSGFSRGVSKYRGVARHHHNGRWEARIGRVFGNKYLYLGTYSTQEEAAHAYDIAAIEYRGINAVTNFDLSTYIRWLRPGAANALPMANPLETHTNGEPQHTQIATNNFLSNGNELFAHRNPFVANDINSPCKHEFVAQRISDSGLGTKHFSSSSSSPSALDLLLRSSMFRQLMEKNPNSPDGETYHEDMANMRPQLGTDDEFHSTLYADVPYVCSSSVENQSSIEMHGDASYHEHNEQALWNGALSLPSMQ